MSPSSTAGIQSLQDYAMKVDTRVAGPWSDGSRYLGEDLITQLYPWQAAIKDMCAQQPDDRTINVLHNASGNIGKSAFCKYMAFHFKAPVIGWAKSGDILNLVSKMPNKLVYLFDLSRSRPQDWAKDDVPAAMEGIKNGLFMNTKYETSQVIMKCPHIWMFCNHLPNLGSMSVDRWKIWTIKNDIMVRLTPAEISGIRTAEKKQRDRDNSPVARRGSSVRGRGRNSSISVCSSDDE